MKTCQSLLKYVEMETEAHFLLLLYWHILVFNQTKSFPPSHVQSKVHVSASGWNALDIIWCTNSVSTVTFPVPSAVGLNVCHSFPRACVDICVLVLMMTPEIGTVPGPVHQTAPHGLLLVQRRNHKCPSLSAHRSFAFPLNSNAKHTAFE